MHLKFENDVSISPFNAIIYLYICSRSVEKYFRGGSRLNWPEGAVSRESIRAVKKLDRLKVPPFSPSAFDFNKPEVPLFWYIF